MGLFLFNSIYFFLIVSTSAFQLSFLWAVAIIKLKDQAVAKNLAKTLGNVILPIEN